MFYKLNLDEGNFVPYLVYFDPTADPLSSFHFAGKKLDRKDLFGSSDPFLQFSRSSENGNFVVVHRTEHIKNTLNPVWAKFTLPIRALCNGDLDRSLKVGWLGNRDVSL